QPRAGHAAMKPNQVGQVILYGIPIVSLVIDGQERLCLAQISNTLLKNFSYNEIHNRRVALGITCVQCTPVQLEILRRAGAMPISSRRCGMITKREAERLCKSFLGENRPPKLPDNFAFDVSHECAWGCRGSFIPARYNSSRAKCIKCSYCSMYFSPNKFIFHSHRTPDAKYTQPDAANFNSWRRHLKLTDKSPQDELVFAWEDVKAMFNGSVKAAAAVVGGGLLSPHLLAAPPELHQKRPRFEEDEELQEAVAAAHGGKGPRSYPVIPVPSKGSFGGVLQKFPGCGGLFPHPYGFPAAAFGLCHKKEEGGGAADGLGGAAAHKAGGGAAGGGLSGLFWPGRKDAAFYPPFCMFWPPRTPGGLPLHGGGPPRSASPPLQLLLPPPPPPPEEPGCERHPLPLHTAHRLLSPGGTSCSFASEDSSEEEEEEEEEEPEVDVEGHKAPEEEEEEEEDEEEEGEEDPRGGDPLGAGGRFPPARGLPENGGRERPAAGPFPRPPAEEKPGEGQAPTQPPLGPPRAGSGGSSPAHHPTMEEQPSYKDVNVP
ncbi:SKR1B protein, partial [Podargus strigoides]|nr:SKR1B protein [Podargus strigoides]